MNTRLLALVAAFCFSLVIGCGGSEEPKGPKLEGGATPQPRFPTEKGKGKM